MLSSNRRLQVNVPALQKIMLEFARENERSELTGELIGDTLDDALADDGDAEAEDKIVSQVSHIKGRSGGVGWQQHSQKSVAVPLWHTDENGQDWLITLEVRKGVASQRHTKHVVGPLTCIRSTTLAVLDFEVSCLPKQGTNHPSAPTQTKSLLPNTCLRLRIPATV